MFDKKKNQQETPVNVASVTLRDSEPVRPAQAAMGGNQGARPAVIGTTIQVSGDIVGGENLLVEGRVEGAIRLEKHDLTSGNSGQAHANLTAKLVRIEGEVVGDVVGLEKVVIASSGRVRGNITAPRVIIEDGARFKGMIDMDFEGKGAEKPAGRDTRRGNSTVEDAVSRAVS